MALPHEAAERLAAGWPKRRIDELVAENNVPALEPREPGLAETQPVA